MRKNILKSRTTAVVAAAATLGLLVTGGAVAAGQIGSHGIANNSIKSIDVKNGSLQYGDLGKGARGKLENGKKFAALERRLADVETRLAAVEDELDGGTRAPFEGNDGSTVSGDTATLVLAASDTNGTSVETTNLDTKVDSGDVITFKYELSDGAKCTGGAPRMFIVVNNVTTNSWDQLQPQGTQCGTNNVVSFKATETGSIGPAGLVYDNGVAGKVTISDVTIDGAPMTFE